MSEQELRDPLLLAVRAARPAIDDGALSPTSADALKVLERVLQGEDPGLSPEINTTRVRQRILRRRNPASRRILRPRIGAIAIATAGVVAAAVIVLSGISAGPSLVDRAYAAISAGYQVLHEVDIQTEPRLHGYYERIEGWLLPADGRTRVIDVSGYRRARYVTISEYIITATGRVFNRPCLSGCRSNDVSSFIDGHARWTFAGHVAGGRFGGAPGTVPGTFAGWFRTAYRTRAVEADGTATFDGRRAARFQSMAPTFANTLVFWRPGTRPPRSVSNQRGGGAANVLIAWYVDPATAQPIGFKVFPCASVKASSCKGPPFTTRIVTFERLDPTTQNLALLTGPNAPPGAR